VPKYNLKLKKGKEEKIHTREILCFIRVSAPANELALFSQEAFSVDAVTEQPPASPTATQRVRIAIDCVLCHPLCFSTSP
jgi:hypothetical protein